jgi:predicted glycoside hydrolase/deacetylase ChbG (UPF0249 family)
MRPIIVCADDAGWQEDNDEVIWAHAQAHQISAASLLIDGPTAAQWGSFAADATCALGLHFNLTWSANRGSRALARLIASAFTRTLDNGWVRAEIKRQISRFETLIGHPPDYIDGHQHVHVLPGVRDALLDHLNARYPENEKPLIRTPHTTRWRGSKSAVLNMLGASRMASTLKEMSWPTNPDFAGVYDFSTAVPYRERMLGWLEHLPPGGVIMCHPGSATVGEHGPARKMESDYLGSDQWARDLAAQNATLLPFRLNDWPKALKP